MNGEAVTLRPARDDDYAFLRRLYGSTREEEMQHFPFDAAQREAFLDQQFAAQHEHYRIHYPECERNVIERDGLAVGRILVDEWKDQIRVVDIALLPEHRNSGIGSMLLNQVLDRAEAARKDVTIHVEANNPAMRLYERLGFRRIDTNGVYDFMRWTPPQVKTAS